MIDHDPTPQEALDEARDDVENARHAAASGDDHRRSQYARSAIDAAATTLLDPTCEDKEVVAARYFLREALALDGQAHSCGSDSIDTPQEASTLSDADRQWLEDYLASRPHRGHRSDVDLSL
jgi:hypothetical protein